ncbi:TonB-dependent receptor domain-containing protein [Hyphococcus sp. DH-69]|uniref:TonB-dependent receptor domain-containing protein n=1 Tax=Hyphococcus formosus TaxID=3143534 RepID=UPI00398AC138
MNSKFKLSLLVSVALSQSISASFAQSEPNAGVTNLNPGDDTIVVEGLMQKAQINPVKVLSGEELIRRRQGTLGETLSGMPGVHMDNFGGGASRPVIRGQTIPRIEILSDGANIFDASALSPDHAIVTDPLLLDAIEVQRGPAAVVYGGNALNGAINLVDSKVPKSLPEDGIDGAGEVRYSTVDNGVSTAGRATMAAGPFAIHVEGSTSDADNYEVPDEFGAEELKDSFAQSNSYSVGASWVTDKGYIGAAYTVQNAEYGLPGHSHANAACHTHGLDLHCATHGSYTDPFVDSNDDHIARINLRNERVDVRADFEKLLPGLQHARLRLSYTDYNHDEVDGSLTFSQYTNEAYDARLELTHEPFFGFTGTLGGQYTDAAFTGLNFNTAHENDDPQEYTSENIGIFLTEQRSFGPIEIALGVRKDWRTLEATKGVWSDYFKLVPGYDYPQELLDLFPVWYDEYFEKNFPATKHNPLSASLGAKWNLDNGYSVSATLARSQRAPSVRELYARGNNLATNSYEVGLAKTESVSSQLPPSTTDVEETTKSIDITLRKEGGPIEFELGLFHQDIDDYIFAQLIEEETNGHRLFVYTAEDVTFTGVDGQVSYRFDDTAIVTLFGDYVHANLTDDNSDELPRIPPGRLGARYDFDQGPFAAGLEFYRTFSKDTVASYETVTDGYNMLNATFAYRLELSSNRTAEVYARTTNLTDELAYVHTSFVKDQSPLRGRSVVFGLRTTF